MQEAKLLVQLSKADYSVRHMEKPCPGQCCACSLNRRRKYAWYLSKLVGGQREGQAQCPAVGVGVAAPGVVSPTSNGSSSHFQVSSSQKNHSDSAWSSQSCGERDAVAQLKLKAQFFCLPFFTDSRKSSVPRAGFI